MRSIGPVMKKVDAYRFYLEVVSRFLRISLKGRLFRKRKF